MKTKSFFKALFFLLIFVLYNLKALAQKPEAEPPIITQTKVKSADVDKITATVAAKVRLAAIKAILNTTNAADYPLPADVNANEYILKQAYAELSEKFKNRFKENALKATTPNGRLRAFGTQTQVKLNTNIPVSGQISNVKFTGKINYTASPIVAAVGASATCSPSTKLSLTLNSVKCMHTTDDWGPEDEMYFSGFAVTPNGTIVKSPTFKLGDFSNKNPPMTKSYGRLIQTFNIGSTDFPKKFNYIFIPVESDGGSVSKFINSIVDLARKELKDYLPNIPLINLDDIILDVLSSVLNDIWDYFFGNEVFKEIAISQNITSNKMCLDGSSKTGAEFRTISKGFSGKYYYYWQWRLE